MVASILGFPNFFFVLRKWWRRREFLINKIMTALSLFMLDPIEILYFVVLTTIDPMQTTEKHQVEYSPIKKINGRIDEIFLTTNNNILEII
jgi:hypothetical protein